MFRQLRAVLATASLLISPFCIGAETEKSCPDWLNHKVGQLHSDKVIDLCEVTSGKPVLLVNTASYCGYTKQFGGLENLHQKYKDIGLVVIGFPSNSFNQEADEEAKIEPLSTPNSNREKRLGQEEAVEVLDYNLPLAQA